MTTAKDKALLKEFIALYRENTSLWEVKAKEYMDKNKKEAAYKVKKLKVPNLDAVSYSLTSNMFHLRNSGFVNFEVCSVLIVLAILENFKSVIAQPQEFRIGANDYPHLPQTANPLLNNKDNSTSNKLGTECENGVVKMKNTFGWEDYSVLSAMLIITCGIGVFYGFIGSQQKTGSDFLLGGGSMSTFPTAMSLAASFVTAIELLGNPAEMYNYGSQFWMICVAFILVVPITSKFYLPVFMTLRLTSSYEYLQMRFDKKISLFASSLYILQMVLYTSVSVYAPALALSHVTGLNVYLAVTVVYVVCIFYASQGGMKAVIMTDTFQATILIVSIVLVLYFGEKFVGGVRVIWPENYNTNRLELFEMNPSPAIRHSFWSVTVGGTFYWMTMFCSNQASIQKYLSVENIAQARKALWVSSIGLILIYTINFYTGMVLVSHYKNCDPLRSNEITASDEILPFYIISELGHMKGITGFFVAGIFAASLGTVASALNSLAAVTCTDFIGGAFGIKITEAKEAFWAKCVSVLYGIISFGLVFIVEQLGSVMQVALSFNGMVGGVTLGLFSLGMFFPWANSKGAIVGGAIALSLVMWLGLGQQIAFANGTYVLEHKPTSTEHCECLNVTDSTPKTSVISMGMPFLYRISYLWYSAIGFTVTIIVGLIISAITGLENPKNVNEELQSPPINRFYKNLPSACKKVLNIPAKSLDSKEIELKGVINHSLETNDEKF
ncbi:hypothetical protein FQR65_LT08427 [Abscondita terminalis]|nr:hypothetical protein FQR65_LT08427 [Abscondita terminalis]